MRPLDPATKANIKKQVEFYFSDSNVPRDKFLMERIKAHPEGYVEIAVICSFSRMAHFLGRETGQKPDEIPNDVIAGVAEVLRTSDDLVVNPEGDHVKRVAPLGANEDLVKDLDRRSIYATPFPYDCTLDHLTQFFNQYAPVRAVRMRRHASKDFKGSIFVEFESPELAEQVASREDIEHEGAPLRFELKTAYMARKITERKAQAMQNPKSPKASSAPKDPEHDPGLVVQISFPDVDDVNDLHYGKIKHELGGRDFGIVYVEYRKGSREAYARLSNTKFVDELLSRAGDSATIPIGTDGIKGEVQVLEGEQEKDFYRRAEEARRAAELNKVPGGGAVVVENSNKRKGNFNDRGRGRGRGRGGRGRFGRAGRIN